MKTKRKRIGSHRWRLVLIVAGALFMLLPDFASGQSKPAWQERWEKVVSEAKKEGKVVVWGNPGELIREAMTQGFRKAFPDINIEYSGARGDEQATRARAEREGGIYSVDVLLSGTATAILYFKPMGALDAIEPALILPEVTDLKQWRGRQLEFADKESKYNLVFNNQVLPPLVYNPKEVKAGEIDEISKLLDQKWKGKIVINDPLPTGPGQVTFRWFWEALGRGKAEEFYRKIRLQAGAVDRDQRRQIEWVAQGKYSVLLAPSSTVGQQLLQRGLKFEFLPEMKDIGGFISATFGSLMLINKAPHSSAAKLFVNWLLTKEGQLAWSKAMNGPSRRVDVPTDHLPAYVVPKPGAKYWVSHMEQALIHSPEEQQILKELFGR